MEEFMALFVMSVHELKANTSKKPALIGTLHGD